MHGFEILFDIVLGEPDLGDIDDLVHRFLLEELCRCLNAKVADALDMTEGRSRIPFQAGQYINIILDDGQRRAFSFANPPYQADLIELQIRLMPGGRFTTHVFEQMKKGDTVRFEGPLGDFTLRA